MKNKKRAERKIWNQLLKDIPTSNKLTFTSILMKITWSNIHWTGIYILTKTILTSQSQDARTGNKLKTK